MVFSVYGNECLQILCIKKFLSVFNQVPYYSSRKGSEYMSYLKMTPRPIIRTQDHELTEVQDQDLPGRECVEGLMHSQLLN